MNPAMCLSGSALTVKNIVRRALERNYAEIRLLSKGGVQPNLNLEKVRGIVVPLWSSVEAEYLEDAVSSAFECAARVSSSYEQLELSLGRLDRAILAKAFRGELVPQDPSDEPADVMLARTSASTAPAREKRGRRPGAKESHPE